MSPLPSQLDKNEVIENIRTRLKQSGVSVQDLLEEYEAIPYEPVWRSDPRITAVFARKLISTGHPARAIQRLRDSMEQPALGADQELKYLLALAFVRGGNLREADLILSGVEKEQALEKGLYVEVHALRGRIFKDNYRQLVMSGRKDTESLGRMKECAQLSAAAYSRAYERVKNEGKPDDIHFPLINLATMTLMGDDPAKAAQFAEEVVRIGEPLLQEKGKERDYWLRGTLVVANIIRSDHELALVLLRDALRLAGDNIGDINSIRRDLHLLREKTPGMWDDILAECRLGNVAAFAGHTIDRPDHYRNRFPSSQALLRRVRLRIQEELGRLNVQAGYCSAACGADILFAEELLNRRGAELHVVLPYSEEDFLRRNVEFGQEHAMAWRMRFKAILTQAKQVHYATTDKYLGDQTLYRYHTNVLQGLALIRAAERDVEAVGLAVLDESVEPEPLGVANFIKQWNQSWNREDRQCHIIDLARERQREKLYEVAERLPGAKDPDAGKGPSRHVKAMLFGDVKGFSKLTDEHFRFFPTILEVSHKVLKESQFKPCFLNTWGDGLFAVFDSVVHAADFALRLLDRMGNVNWGGVGFPGNLLMRIGLHAGPVYEHENPLLGKMDFAGSHVNRAARIEPVTTPGCAFASEQFAAILKMTKDHPFECELVGIEKLAKDYDRCSLYRLTRR
jgi:class 3 adenylate cyclase